MPVNPKRPPPMSTASSTQKLPIPIALPMTLGPITLPSICCMMSMMITKYRAFTGSSVRSSTIEGTAPMKGPKNGMTFVTPTITLIIRANGMSVILSTM